MSIQVTCNACTRQFNTPDEARGRRFKCPACGSPIDVPSVAAGDDDPLGDPRWNNPPAPAPPVAPPPLDPFLAQRGPAGANGLPPVQVKSQRVQVKMSGGLIDFIGDHKLVLGALACTLGMFWVWRPWNNLGTSLILMFVGILIAAGAWRSQHLANRRDKEAEDWRFVERIFGALVLLGAAGYVTVYLGILLSPAVEPVLKNGLSKQGAEALAKLLGIWAGIVGYCVLNYVLSFRFGFFKVTSWTYVTLSLFIFSVATFSELWQFRWAPRQPGQEMAREPRQPLPPRFDRPGFGDRPSGGGRPANPPGDRTKTPRERKFSRFDLPEQTKPLVTLSPKDFPDATMGRLSGTPVADELSKPTDAAEVQIPEVRLGAGSDSEVAERRPAVRWTAKPDPLVANLKSEAADPQSPKTAAKSGGAAIKRLAQVPLAEGALVTVPRVASPWLAVSGGGKETTASIKLYHLLTLAEREIKGKIAVGSPRALSPDGKYFAAFNSQENSVDVWWFENGKLAARLWITAGQKPTFIDLSSGDQLVVGADAGKGAASTAKCVFWKLTSPTQQEIMLPKSVQFENGLAAVSPGGKYLAAYHDAGVSLVDTATGKLCGKLKIVENEQSGQFFTKPVGLSFSPDGEELACLVNRFRGSRIIAWNMKDGATTADHNIDAERNHFPGGEQQKSLVCFPDHKAWLVSGKSVVDAKAGGQASFGLKYKEGIFDREFFVYGLADNDRLIVGSPQMITTWTIPRGIDGEIETKSLVVSADDLPSGMLPEGEQRFARFSDDEEEQTLSGEELELASRRYRQQAQLKVLASNDDKLSSLLGWYPAAKRPTFGLRVGVGAQAPDGSKDLIPLSSLKSLSEFTGKVGPQIVRELRQRFRQDAFGDWPQTEDSSARGIMYVGVGPRDKIVPAAKRAEFDVVVVLEVARQQIGNTKRFDMLLRARVTDAAGEPVWVSPGLSSEKAVAAEKDGQDLVKPFVAEVLAKIDELYSLKPMPVATADAAKQRVKAIVQGDVLAADKLTAAAELRYYQITEFLSAAEALPAYQQLFDEETAQALASCDARKRRAALEKWATDNSL